MTTDKARVKNCLISISMILNLKFLKDLFSGLVISDPWTAASNIEFLSSGRSTLYRQSTGPLKTAPKHRDKRRKGQRICIHLEIQ